jgi:hypothetical protein
MESMKSTTVAAPIAATTAPIEDKDDSIPSLLPPNLNASDDDDSSDEENEQPPQIKMAILPFDPRMILLEATAPLSTVKRSSAPSFVKCNMHL